MSINVHDTFLHLTLGAVLEFTVGISHTFCCCYCWLSSFFFFFFPLLPEGLFRGQLWPARAAAVAAF
jgi:hypothetical protein